MTVGAPDWSTPSPGGAHMVILDNVDMSTGNYDSGWRDCTAFNGLFLALSAVGLSSQFGTVNVSFQDPNAQAIQLPIYAAIYGLGLRSHYNIPVLGAQVRVVIHGPAAASVGTLSLIGHNGGPEATVSDVTGRLVECSNATLAANTVFQGSPGIICQGPGSLMCLVDNAQTGLAQLWEFDQNGARHLFARTQVLTGSNATTISVWVPPYPIQMEVTNAGTASAPGFYGTLSLGRV